MAACILHPFEFRAAVSCLFPGVHISGDPPQVLYSGLSCKLVQPQHLSETSPPASVQATCTTSVHITQHVSEPSTGTALVSESAAIVDAHPAASSAPFTAPSLISATCSTSASSNHTHNGNLLPNTVSSSQGVCSSTGLLSSSDVTRKRKAPKSIDSPEAVVKRLAVQSGQLSLSTSNLVSTSQSRVTINGDRGTSGKDMFFVADSPKPYPSFGLDSDSPALSNDGGSAVPIPTPIPTPTPASNAARVAQQNQNAQLADCVLSPASSSSPTGAQSVPTTKSANGTQLANGLPETESEESTLDSLSLPLKKTPPQQERKQPQQSQLTAVPSPNPSALTNGYHDVDTLDHLAAPSKSQVKINGIVNQQVERVRLELKSSIVSPLQVHLPLS